MRTSEPVPMTLAVDGLSKRFGATQALDGLALTVAPGEIVAVSGPSGAGKSTLGRLLSGLESADRGEIRLGSRAIQGLPPQQRAVAHMFESFALYPTLNVFDNVASPLRSPMHAGRIDPASIAERVENVLALTQMSHLARRRPAELSGGQKQRVALCRTLVQTPDLFILDEPIGHLDAKLRHTLRGDIRARQGALAQGTLWFTPDAVEAMAVADRVVMLVGGRVRQIGTPRDIYLRPADTSVARLVGDPAMNLLDITLTSSDGSREIRHAGDAVRASPALRARLAALPGERYVLGFPPMHTQLCAPASAEADVLPGEIYAVEPFGKYTLVTASLAGALLRAKVAPGYAAPLGAPVGIRMPESGVLIFDGDTGSILPDQ
ncbi:Dihydroxyacetone ABC transport system, ATP-binding protein |uniref:Dihydroxyacetone ABC transport system, ATP-binding protein \